MQQYFDIPLCFAISVAVLSQHPKGDIAMKKIVSLLSCAPALGLALVMF